MLTDGISFLLRGGPVMWPLFICAIWSVTVMIERYFALRGVASGSRSLAVDVRDALQRGRRASAEQILNVRGGPVSRLLSVAVKNSGLPRLEIEALVTEAAAEEMPALTRGLSSLDTIITIAPLLGLLGTVTGMIKAFQVVAISSGQAAPATTITGGVAEALIATATGLAIAIVTLVGYNYLSEQVKSIVSMMDAGANKIINVLQQRPTLPPLEENRYEAATL